MVAPVVTRLSAEIAACSDEYLRAEFSAELACYFARDGDAERAAKITEELRSRFGSGKHARISILIMLIEALRFYFTDQDPRAHDRLRRACLISGMVRDRQLIALTEAWMAHLCFNQGRFSEFGASLARARANLDEDNLPAKCRLAISVADSYLLIGNQSASNFWYSVARDAAVRYGDQAAIGAVTYNRAALGVYALRTSLALGEDFAQDPSLLLVEVDSAINYQRVAGLTSLDQLLYTAKIGSLIALRQFSEARDLAQQLLGSVSTILNSAQQTMLAFDHALCTDELREEQALRTLFSEDSFVESCLALDAADRLIIFSTLKLRGLEQVGSANAREVSHLLECSKSEFESEQFQIFDAVSQLQPA